MKRVLFVVRGLGVGGIQRVTIDLANGMKNLGHEVDILTFSDNAFYDVSELSVIKFEYPLKSLLGVTIRVLNKFIPLLGCILFNKLINKKFENKIRELEKLSNITYDHIYFCGFGVSSLTYKSFPERSTFVFHNTKSQMLKLKSKRLYRFTKYLYKNVLSEMNSSIAVSDGIKKDLITEFSVPSKKIKVIYNPINYPLISRMANEPISSEFKPKEYFVYVGRLVKEKRLDILIEGFLASKFQGDLLVFGEGPEKTKYDEYVKNNNIKNIKFMGKTDNPYSWMKNSKALILTSDFEGLPTVLIEALVSGTSVISTDCPSGPKEILTGKLSHNLVPCGDVKSLAYKINDFVDENNDFNVEVYDIVNVVNNYFSVFDKR
ncbi:glycosyltransferase [Aeromonas caviae]|uniref:glycosyltransferase n=1 Tax=Aeromonas caviae TaxID=648 RepID=UPI0029DB1536|nr:glycosyltransferase [Aeromonas caviae]MDX7767845.1 glycosyltransferase [Aeromonas caviae]